MVVAIVVNDDEIAQKCRMISNHGRIAKYNHEFEGRNSRLDNLQAAILNKKLNYLEMWNAIRIELADYYIEILKNVEEIVLPKRKVWAKQVYHLFVIRTNKRDELKDYLNNKGVQTGIHYPISLPKLKAYEYINQKKEDFIANSIDSKVLSLPIGEHLRNEDIDFVTDSIKDFFK